MIVLRYSPVNVVFGVDFADCRNHGVKPPHSVSLDGSNLILKRPQDLQVLKKKTQIKEKNNQKF